MAKGHRSQIKKERNAENKDVRPQAHAKYVRISDQKAKIVLDLIKGKRVADAAAILRFSPRYAAEIIAKVLNSAVANAENNLGLDPETLFVAEAYANRGKTHVGRFRLRARARGRGYRIERKFSHISIVLGEKDFAPKKNAKGNKAGGGNAKADKPDNGAGDGAVDNKEA